MSKKQDRVRARTPTDLERKYGLRKAFAEMTGIVNDSREKVDSVESGLRSEIDKQETSLMEALNSVESELRNELTDMEASLKQNAAELVETAKKELGEDIAEVSNSVNQLSDEVGLKLDEDAVSNIVENEISELPTEYPNPFELNINGKNYNGSLYVDSGIENGSWLPVLNVEGLSYTVQQGWYQKVGKVVTIGWQIKADIGSDYSGTELAISGAPYIPVYAAYGGGVAHNIYIQGGFAFEGWGINDSGLVSAILQPCNNTTDSNLNTISTSCYPFGGGEIMLAGTICYITQTEEV